MTESAERVGAHGRHPNFNLANARRLIAALQRSVPAAIARARPMEINGSPAAEGDVWHMAVDSEGERGIPVAYDQGTWGCPIHYDSVHFCGTAACIAGFAWLMREADRGNRVSVDALSANSESMGASGEMTRALAKFLGVGADVAEEMSCPLGGSLSDPHRLPPQPRHAVAMLEIFIRTGTVMWSHALGLMWVARMKRDWKGLRPWRKRARAGWEMTGAEKALQRGEIRERDAARRSQLERLRR